MFSDCSISGMVCLAMREMHSCKRIPSAFPAVHVACCCWLLIKQTWKTVVTTANLMAGGFVNTQLGGNRQFPLDTVCDNCSDLSCLHQVQLRNGWDWKNTKFFWFSFCWFWQFASRIWQKDGNILRRKKIFKRRKETKICTMVVTYHLAGKAIIKELIVKSTEKCLDPLQNVQPTKWNVEDAEHWMKQWDNITHARLLFAEVSSVF